MRSKLTILLFVILVSWTDFALSEEFSPERVVICIHGFMRTKTNMNLFRYFLKKENWKVYAWEYQSKDKYIEEHGEDLARFLIKVTEKHPNVPIDFITHSMGGLVLRSGINHPACPEAAKNGKAVLVAPPNQGSSFGRFLGQFKPIEKIAGQKAGQQLINTERGGFDALGEFPDSMKVLVIAGTCGFNPVIEGKNDGKVGIDETRLSTPHDFLTIFAGHSWICHTPKTVIMAIEFLKD